LARMQPLNHQGAKSAKERMGKFGALRTFAVRFLILWMIVSLVPQATHAQGLPPSAYVANMVGHPQEHNLSCESRSSIDLAAFWGVSITEDDYFRRLPKSDNPHRGFLGDVDQPAGTMPPYGYGVYAGPVAANLRSFGLDATSHRNWTLYELKAEIAAGRPVIIWSTYDMELPGVQEWTSSDGETSLVVRWQHTFVAVGYEDTADGGRIFLLDAYDAATKQFTYGVFDTAWAQMERLAVTVYGPLANPSEQTWKATGNGQFIVDGRWETGTE
jgi:uncharacterized protein YvpB